MLNDCVGEEFKGTVQTPTNFTIHIYLPGVVFFSRNSSLAGYVIPASVETYFLLALWGIKPGVQINTFSILQTLTVLKII
jgi:hypothetical protein